jgi:hypothetical protein
MCRRGLEMKDGDKAKAKATKTSGKEISSKSSAGEKGGKAVKASPKKESSSASKAEAAKKSAGSKGSSAESGGSKAKSNGKAGRSDPATISFTNPAIESAFNRAVKKYPNAFRRLTD